MRLVRRFASVLLLLVLGFVSEARAASVAIYKDKGAWSPSYTDTARLLKKLKHDTRFVNANEIRQGILSTGAFQALVMPGGESWTYLDSLGPQGADQIRDFVRAGGAYLGFCAGAFYATSHREGGHTTGSYGIGLLEGTAQDPFNLGLPGFADGMKKIDFNLTAFKPTYTVVFLEGVQFQLTEGQRQSQNVKIIARFRWNQEIAALSSTYGKGRVFLSGPHPEVEEPRRKDPDSEWPLLESMIHWTLGGEHPQLRTQH